MTAFCFILQKEGVPTSPVGVPLSSFFFHVSRTAEFKMTATEPALCTSAPTTGFNIPVIARTIAIKFKDNEKARLHLIVIIIRFAR